MKRTMREMRGEARAAIRPVGSGAPVFASDLDPNLVELTRANAKDAGVELVLETGDVRLLTPTEPPGFVVTNPPYGQRLDADRPFFRDMARALLALQGHRLAILAGSSDIEQAFNKKPDKWWALYNGNIECRLLTYRV
jgi:23S rRNA G2445 N2-methylase RlmL